MPALATPDPLVAIWIVPVELENVPLCPLLPVVAVKVTLYEGMTTELASFTVTDRAVVNALPMVADWLLPALMVTLAGTWITVAVSLPSRQSPNWYGSGRRRPTPSRCWSPRPAKWPAHPR